MPRVSWFRAEVIVFVIFLLASLIAYRTNAFTDNGTFWHTRCGEIMLDRGRIIETDPFTAPFQGQEWRPQQWLAEIVMAISYRQGGWDLLLLLFCALIAGMDAWLVATLRERGVPLLIAFFITGAIWLGTMFHGFIRPHMITMVLTAWTLHRLIAFDRGQITLTRLAWFIPVFILWTNLHGGVIGGLMMLALCGAWWLLAFLLNRSSPIKNWPAAGVFCVISILTALTPLVNPYGVGMIRIWQKIVGSKAMKEFVLEHQMLDWRDPTGIWVLSAVGVYLLFVVLSVGRGFRITWLMPLIWMALSFQGIRQGPLAMVTALVAIGDVWRYSWISRRVTISQPILPSRRWMVGPVVIVVAIAIFQKFGPPVKIIGRDWAGLNPDSWPEEIKPQIIAAAAKLPEGSPIFNDVATGGYLITTIPHVRVFMDDRFELCGDDAMSDTIFGWRSSPASRRKHR
jgi:hypothetical protein